jgi:hypothetical protein
MRMNNEKRSLIYVLLFTVLIFLPGLSARAQEANIDPDIVTISSGSIYWKNSDLGVRFRIVAFLSEVYLHLFVQKIEYGEETCCAKIVKTYELKKLETMEGSVFSISDIVWLKNDSVRFKANETTYLLSTLDGTYTCEKFNKKK